MPILLLVLIVLAPCAVAAEETHQNDWSGGATAEATPSSGLGSGFSTVDNLSWAAVPGQLSLASRPLDPTVKHLIATGHPGAYGLYAIDFDRDGDMDVLGTTDSSRAVVIWFNEGGSPPSWTEHVVDDDYPGGTSLHPVDMDDDGDLDLVGAAQLPGNNLSWWRNDGGSPLTWTRFTLEADLPVACNLFVDDLDGDGDPDVASTSWAGAYVAWWRNDGENENWDRIMIDDAAPGAHSTFTLDADGDGDRDLAAAVATNGQVMLYYNEGDAASWSPQVIGEGMNGVRYVTAADIDDDGRTDLAAAAFNGQLRWWRNLGGSPVQWSEHLVDSMCIGGHYLMAADLDGDGARDILVVPWNLSSLYWYAQNPEDPDDWTEHLVEFGFTSPLTAFPADLDGDGDLDVVGTSAALGEIAWWEITEFVDRGSLESEVIDLASPAGMNAVRWEALVPGSTELRIKLRSGPQPDSMGSWSVGVTDPTIFCGPWQRYLQYRIEMRSDLGAASPLLRSIGLSWGFGINDEPLPPAPEGVD